MANKTKVEPVAFSVNIRQSEGVSLVDVKGRLTSFEAAAFRQAIHGLLDQGHRNIVLNLTGWNISTALELVSWLETTCRL